MAQPKFRPWKVKDADNKVHSFSTKKAAHEFRKTGKPYYQFSDRPIKLQGDNRAKSLAKVYQAQLRAQGEKQSLRQIAGNPNFKKFVADLYNPKKRDAALVKLGRRKRNDDTYGNQS